MNCSLQRPYDSTAPTDSALVSVGKEVRIINGVALAGKFDVDNGLMPAMRP
jgi:hypothetical protein